MKKRNPSTPHSDDLTRIEGIDSKSASLLVSSGFTTFDALAKLDVTSIEKIFNAAGASYNLLDPTTWPEQAQLAADGKWESLDKLQVELKGGKRVAKSSSSGFQFRTPANIQDFSSDPTKQQALRDLWSQNLDGFIKQGMQSNQWNTINTPPTTNYYNPIDKNPASNIQAIEWSAFPGRLAFNYPNSSQDELNQMADEGNMPAEISTSPCDPANQKKGPYFPYGPRGWQDEYCEWAVTRNGDGKITRIDFTCENPEYWNSLWQIDPNKVVSLYQSILGKPQITLEDLSLPGANDPITNQPFYNPLNKWNSGTVSNDTEGGAIHLTSTPNTIQTEIGLATAATVLRNNPSGGTSWPLKDYNPLLCDAQYGQKNRNSDPNIGGNVNHFVNGGIMVTLADPPGLYIQMPDFNIYQTPDNTDASEFWTIVRGTKNLKTQDGTSLPGNFILHAVFEVPSSKNYTVSDITIQNHPIDWGAQVAATFKMHIVASAYGGTKPIGHDPVIDAPKSLALAQPLQLFDAAYFDAMYPVMVPNPVNNPISLLSNSTFIPPTIMAGASTIPMVLTAATCKAEEGNSDTYPQVTFDDSNVTAVVTSVQNNITYAVPGNSAPGTSYTAIFLDVSVHSDVTPSVKGIFLTNPGQRTGPAMKALLNVIPVTCRADVKWQNTGIEITAGETTNVIYSSGNWTANPNTNNGELYGPDGVPQHTPAQSGYTMPGQNEGALIGKVGDTVFLIGRNVTIPSNLSGTLELCINDDLDGQYGAGFSDNQGAIEIRVEIKVS